MFSLFPLTSRAPEMYSNQTQQESQCRRTSCRPCPQAQRQTLGMMYSAFYLDNKKCLVSLRALSGANVKTTKAKRTQTQIEPWSPQIRR